MRKAVGISSVLSPHMDEVAKEQLGMLIAESRERELATSIAEQREPRLRYPAIDIADVRSRIEGVTPSGRATVAKLQMNHPHMVALRRLHAELGIPVGLPS